MLLSILIIHNDLPVHFQVVIRSCTYLCMFVATGIKISWPWSLNQHGYWSAAGHAFWLGEFDAVMRTERDAIAMLVYHCHNTSVATRHVLCGVLLHGCDGITNSLYDLLNITQIILQQLMQEHRMHTLIIISL